MTAHTIPDHAPTPLARIDEIYATLSARFDSRATHPLAYRLYNLKQLAYMIQDNESVIQEAMFKDLGKSGFDASLGDLWPILNEIDLAVRKVQSWMKDEWRLSDALLSFKFMRPRVKKQPKGVALIIGAWNYPWQLQLVPLVGAIAAGCPAVIKVSEHSPASAALMADLFPRYLDPEGYAVVMGAVDEATHLLEKPWGHILYTGSGNVGKIVAQAAAKTLTPSTLELGGKSPVIVSTCANLRITATRMLTIKSMTAGQICVAPDYVLCTEDRIDELIHELTTALKTLFPLSPSPNSFLHTPHSGTIRNDSDIDRLLSFLDHAEKEGKLVHRGEVDKATRRLGISIVRMNEGGVGEKEGLIDQEIFGPILPVIPVRDVDAAIAYINARPKPLALYACSGKRSVFNKIVDSTWSGSVTWNDFAFATYARNLPFGGVGASGWGAYHGIDGFNTFTHRKAVLEIPYLFEPLMSLRQPPISKLSQKLFKFLLCSGVSFARPTSVEGEQAKINRRKAIRWSVLVLLMAVGIMLDRKWREK